MISLATKAVKEMYSSLRDNDQYTSVINERHHKRLSGYLEDAEQRGCRIIPLNPANEDFCNGAGKIRILPAPLQKSSFAGFSGMMRQPRCSASSR